MILRDLLTDPLTINMLKKLQESEQKGEVTLKLSSIQEHLGTGEYTTALNTLESFILIGKETIDNETNLTLTNKGRTFIEAFDQLKNTLTKKEEPDKKLKVVYDVTKKEKKVLLTIQKLAKENDLESIPIKIVAKELYPGQDFRKKVSAVSKMLTRLDQLEMVVKKKEANVNLVTLTEKGKEILKEKILETIF